VARHWITILISAVLKKAGFFGKSPALNSSKQTQDVCFGFVSVSPFEIQKLNMGRRIIGLS